MQFEQSCQRNTGARKGGKRTQLITHFRQRRSLYLMEFILSASAILLLGAMCYSNFSLLKRNLKYIYKVELVEIIGYKLSHNHFVFIKMCMLIWFLFIYYFPRNCYLRMKLKWFFLLLSSKKYFVNIVLCYYGYIQVSENCLWSWYEWIEYLSIDWACRFANFKGINMSSQWMHWTKAKEMLVW